MVPARNLQLLRDAHATPAFLAAALTVHPHHHMAQEPINQEPPKPPPPQEAPQEEEHTQAVLPPPPQQHLQPAAGTSSSSSGGRSSNGGGGGGAGDWLRLGLGPASPGPGAAAPEIDLFTAPPRHGHDVRDNMGMPPGASARPAVLGIPQPSMQMPVPRAVPPWMPPWNPASAHHPSLLLPFGHRGFYGPWPGSPAASSSDFDTIRVVLPPPAATAAAPGIWFVLQAAPHQGKEPFLPQIPRSYLRIKDGRVTVRLLIKYLVNKLRLEDESEVEITCRGRPLLPFMTLQHVRDTIWCQRDAVSPSVSPDMSTANHIMVLQYGRRP